MADKKKILVFTSSFPRFTGDVDGGGNFVFELTKQLQIGNEIFVLAPFMKGAKSKYEIEGIKVKRFKFIPFNIGDLINKSGLAETLHQHKWKYILIPFLLIGQFLSAIVLIKKEKISVVHAHWVVPQGVIAALIKFFIFKKVKILCTVHGSDLNMSFGKFGNYIISQSLSAIDTITVVSNQLKNKIANYNSHSKIPVIPMGIDTKMFRRNSNSKIKKELNIENKMLLFVGVFNEVKGIEYVLKAMPKVLEYDNTIKFVLVGDGAIKDHLMKICHVLNIESRVLFAGFKPQDQLPDYYSVADIVLMPSLSEGSPVVLPEALNCGAVVLTSDIPVYKEIINDGVNGYLSKVKNSDSIAEKIISILSDSKKSNKTKSNSLIYVKKTFDWAVIGDKYLNLISQL